MSSSNILKNRELILTCRDCAFTLSGMKRMRDSTSCDFEFFKMEGRLHGLLINRGEREAPRCKVLSFF
ncbi:hypothetical protein P872_13065 [Rhodonellum psychrophilum GCM71 = DSM 17998]|uniref:Uncharacterized protein n=2 Tax=Rhodonellum TaxID=336827 RepID=U5BSL0_9BACT|nr:hypothetical protein P872_13065 [Rhodonellum psychrophilum GCM71 = DSM 17998]SDZ24382.1 hypothetical protein SAMN05444412_10886 [Rhodonellum ikkaensis]